MPLFKKIMLLMWKTEVIAISCKACSSRYFFVENRFAVLPEKSNLGVILARFDGQIGNLCIWQKTKKMFWLWVWMQPLSTTCYRLVVVSHLCLEEYVSCCKLAVIRQTWRSRGTVMAQSWCSQLWHSHGAVVVQSWRSHFGVMAQSWPSREAVVRQSLDLRSCFY